MEKAKAAIKDFTSRGGHHDTTVEESVNPAIVQERFRQKELEESTTVVDKEVHQDHHHTTVLPVNDREVLPEQHSHNLVGAEHREFRHGDHEGIKDRLAQEAAQFKHTRTTDETVREQTTGQTVGGEHVHHHIHETVQPVIKKDIVQPVVVHTTVPVHETHHHAPTHHGVTSLPAMNMEEFQKRGGTLEGCEPKIDRYEGIVPADEAVQRAAHGFHHHNNDGTHNHHHNHHHNDGTNALDRDTGVTGSTGTHTGHLHHNNNNVGTTTGDGTFNNNNNTTYDNNAVDGTGRSGLASDGLGGNNTHSANPGFGTTGTGTATNYGTETDGGVAKKPSLLNRINPLKDADGDGKKGFMK